MTFLNNALYHTRPLEVDTKSTKFTHMSALELGWLLVYHSFLRVRGLRSITAGDPPGMDPYRLGSPACELPARGMGIPFLTVAFWGIPIYMCIDAVRKQNESIWNIT